MLDIRTLSLVLTITLVLAAMLLWLAYYQHRTMPGLREWVWGKTLIALGVFQLLGRDIFIPPAISIVLVNGLLLIGHAAYYTGALRFMGRRPNPIGAVIVAAGWIPIFFLLDARYLAERIIINSFGFGLLSLMCGLVLWGEGGRTRVAAQRFISGLFTIYGLVSIGRALWVMLDPPPPGSLLQTGASTYVLYSWGIITNFAMTVGFLTLVSEQLRNQLLTRAEEAEVARRAAELSLVEQRNFLSMVSHEFRTPLSTISGATEVLQFYVDENNPKPAGELARIRRAATRLTRLMDGCLADEWLEDASQSRRSGREDLCSMLRAVAAEHGVGLTIAGPTSLIVDADSYLLPIAFSNLIDNAVKYGSGRDGVAIRTLPWGEREAAVEVSNDGPGIDRTEIPRLFEKFYRSPSAQHKPGAGLGLFLVQRIVELHGGRVELDQGTATVFRVILPLMEKPQ